ncbi:DUF1014-domain-containing protein [Terfezia boudieri ATCC MYA-4762]|uniref:DUF1014-domain-containing protein n=1 Tax=Terfezia boudieri ATCC MYA-4762 TaxID=1051890 RepID=A0A3N4L4Y9_9PEZI|nr:DUF1014-domain-containing protein [Terfezia boudieri ATCC MYA-4762]
MPKKPAAENSKKAAGNAKKAASAAAKQAEQASKRAVTEDQEWAKGAKSSAKKEAETEKKAETARKKAEKEALLKAEMETLKSAKPSATKDKSTKKAPAPFPSKRIDAALSGVGGEDSEVLPTLGASGIDDALDALALTSGTGGKEIDRHPEKRVKAAYAAFEERRLQELRVEHPGLRLGQMKEMIRKEFEKSPENPRNQGDRYVTYNATKEEIAAKKQAERVELENRLTANARS